MVRSVNPTILMVVIIATAMVTSFTFGADFDPRDYCGIPPAPAKIPKIPSLPAEAQQLKLTLTDFYIFTRHGDRSTLAKNCWKNMATFKDRKWTECPHNTLGFHSGLSARNSYAPTYAIPIHPLQDKQILNGNCHLGQLTQRGLLMSYNNGLRIGEYLSETFENRGVSWAPTALKLRSTDVHRTRETAEGFITGLLDTMLGDPASLSKQLPPLYFVDDKVDAQKLNTNVCDTGPYIDEVYSGEAWTTYKAETWDPLLTEVRTALNQPDAEMADVFDCIKPFQCHGLAYPDQIKPLDARVEAAMTEYWRAAYYHEPRRSSQLFSGYLLLELSSLFAASAIKPITENPTVNLWSGHDFGSISNLASALTFPDFLWPPYSAMINIEFYKTNSEETTTSFVRFMYLGEVIIPEFCQDSIVATQLCPTEVVLKYIATVLPTAEQCPGIPRQTFEQTQTPKSFLQSEKQSLTPALTNIIENLFDVIDDLRDDLKIVQSNAEQQPKPEKTHQQRWSERS